ncbi:MAG: hypothetical protein LBF41_03490 [Deltaproteobacteria bacterium]|jgi:hypothetical protein|nr:hypothetical protein [Deltaproteobacteria bacterium]
MPLPVFVPVAFGLFGLTGVLGIARSLVRLGKAKSLSEKGKSFFEESALALGSQEDRANSLLSEFARIKRETADPALEERAGLFERLGAAAPSNPDIRPPVRENSSEGTLFVDCVGENPAPPKFAGIRAAILGVSGGSAFGGAMALGFHKFAERWGETLAGASLSSLKGAALRDATLAWLGGGPLSRGGFGIAGGVLFLICLVLSAALFGAGFALTLEARAGLRRSGEYLARAVENREKVGVICRGLANLGEFLSFAIPSLKAAAGRLEILNGKLARTLDSVGSPDSPDSPDSVDPAVPAVPADPAALATPELKSLLESSLELGRALKDMRDAPCLSTEGLLLPEAFGTFRKLNADSESAYVKHLPGKEPL